MTLSKRKTNKICCVFVEPKRDGGRDVSGFLGKYKFFATIKDRKSKLGINEGTVIVLTIWQMSKTVERVSKTMNFMRETQKVCYNRGWKLYPKTKKETMLLSIILHCLNRKCWY